MNFFLIFSCLLIGFLLSSCSSINEQNNDRTWIQINHKSEYELRVITKKGSCPMVTIDGQLQSMETRAPNDSASYPFLVCKKVLPKSYSKLSVNDQQLTPPHPSIDKIAIIGDTGCRDGQDITNLEEWPFPQIVNNISQHNPDLVIHLGDYTYQKDPNYITINEKQDVWDRWRQEFFDPADKLLKQTPWLFLRGNLEFQRREEGWRRLLSAYPYSAFYTAYEEPFWVDSIEDNLLLVYDSSGVLKETRELYDSYPRQIVFPKNNKKNIWLLTHKPSFGVINFKDKDNKQNLLFSDQSSLLILFKPIYEKIRLILSGHIHSFQFIKSPQMPEQFVIGNSGARLEKLSAPTTMDNTIIKSQTIEKGMALNKFGYGILERNKRFWLFSLYSVNNHILVSCIVEKTKSRCEFRN